MTRAKGKLAPERAPDVGFHLPLENRLGLVDVSLQVGVALRYNQTRRGEHAKRKQDPFSRAVARDHQFSLRGQRLTHPAILAVISVDQRRGGEESQLLNLAPDSQLAAL